MLRELRVINTCQPTKDTLVQYADKVEFLKRLIAQDKQPVQGVTERISHNIPLAALSGPPDQKAKDILLKRRNKVVQNARDELFESRPSSRSTEDRGVRQRTPGQEAKGTAGEDFDVVLRYHNSMQEKIAEEMVSLAQNLKQNALLAGHIVKKDTEMVHKNVLTADHNYKRLQDEQSRLEEHIRRSCSCWIWLMLGVVCIVFLQMVVFMRIFPKRY